MSRIFINYRRDDSRPYSNTLYSWLQERYGEDSVFKDVDSIEPGLDFVEAIDRALEQTSVMLVLIGRNWLEDATGRKRLAEPNDYVRMEIAAALERNVRVIPVLVEGATMPEPEQLPEPLAPLSRRHAFEINDTSQARLRADQEDLLRRLDRVLGKPEAPKPEPPPPRAPEPQQQEPIVAHAPPAPAQPAADPDRTRGLIKWGWILVAGSLLIPFAAIAPIVMGAMVISRSQGRRTGMGISLIVVAIVVGLLSLSFWAGQA